MTAVFSILAFITSFLWYFRAAQKKQLPGFAWGVAGGLLYYIGFYLWMHLVLSALMGKQFQLHSFWIGMGMDVSAILAGLSCVSLFYLLILSKK